MSDETPRPIIDLDAAKIGVFTYRSTMGTYTMVIDMRDNAHECFRGANLHSAGRRSARARHVDWDAMPEGARDYFAACMGAGEQL